MKIRRIIFLLIELVLIFIYYSMVLLSINIPPINIILGFFTIFILPGYNLLNVLRPTSSKIEKLGYSIIFSLVIENIFMVLSYIILYNYVTYPETTSQGFIFNSTLLITTFIIINLILIIIREYIRFKSKIEINVNQVRKSVLNLNKLKEKLNFKIISICLLFGISLILLCVSTIYSIVPDNDYLSNYIDYKLTFTFFYRVPLIFYLFLIISISSLFLIIFYSRNVCIKLISISFFIYCLWILPYLQIDNYFSHDTYLLFEGYQNYLTNGLVTHRNFNFTIFNYDTLRYSTGICTTILLTSITNMNINFALWYLYPLLYIFLPFFFYSVFKKNTENKKSELVVIILVIFSTFMPYFIKSGHATGTGLFGALVYTILVLEFYNIVKNKKFNTPNFFLIIILYIFLCLTHTEETLYFLIFLFFYYFYYTFYELKKINKYTILSKGNSIVFFEEKSLNLKEIVEKEIRLRELKIIFIKLGLLIFSLSVIFYTIQEFFGWINYYLTSFLGTVPFFEIFFDIYINSLISIPFILRGGITLSYNIIIIISIGIFLCCSIIYYILFKKFKFVVKIYHIGIGYAKKIFNFIKKNISKKLFPIIFFLGLFFISIFIELIIRPSYRESLVIMVITIPLSYFIFILQIFYFIKGIQYYELKNNKQNFFLLSIMASASVIPFLMITGSFWLGIYFLHSKFSTNFIFFNLIIIQNTYIRDLSEKKYNYLLYIAFLLVSIGVFFCLRKLAYG